ncbi:DUF3105 domain-containing protein [Plantibacter sp. YIM 135347]|uniref:DUF3105 domain-containing protein n=1 Tax=Plantibacter sp. YIM 135347 TaxID=3423919 RepID=UPI003D3300A3
MTPAPDRPSGAPVPPAVKQQSQKQARETQRAAKVAAFKKAQAKKARNKRIGIWAAVVGGVAIIAVLATSIWLTIPKYASYPGGGTGTGTDIAGVKTFQNTAGHVEGKVDYPQNPPAGGEHNPVWLNCGVYTEPVPNENAVHDLEHGAVWVTYDPSISADELAKLKSLIPSTYVVLSPYKDLPSPIVLSGWNVQLQVSNASDKRIPQFFQEFWKSQNVPEPGAPCTGGLDGPGKS